MVEKCSQLLGNKPSEIHGLRDLAKTYEDLSIVYSMPLRCSIQLVWPGSQPLVEGLGHFRRFF